MREGRCVGVKKGDFLLISMVLVQHLILLFPIAFCLDLSRGETSLFLSSWRENGCLAVLDGILET